MPTPWADLFLFGFRSAGDGYASVLAFAPLAIERTLLAVDSGLDRTLEDGLAEEARHFGQCCSTHDKAEGTAAFLAKRPAVWTGE